MNPIWKRESRARWRGWSAFALVFGYVVLLAIALFWRYAWAYSQSTSQSNPLQRIELLGAQLFVTLIWLQTFAWALIAPAITATTIASERESGMLEAVQLSPLSPRQIVTGKLLSALALIALLLLVSIPITGTCLLLGGVSPAEFFAATLLHATTAFFGVALGLACSAWARRAGAALRSAYALSMGWLIASLVSFWSIAISSGGKWFTQLACLLLGWSNPVLATAAIVDNDAWGMATAFAGWGIFETSPWLISVVFQLALGVFLLWSATRALHRPFAEQYWLGTKQQNLIDGSDNTRGGIGSTPNRKLRFKRPVSDWISIPLLSGLHFSNPVLQRETRAKFRMRQPPLGILIFEAILALGVAYYYLMTLRDAVFVPAQRELIWWIINFVGLAVVALAAAVSGASAFSRERETCTWEALRQSLLGPAEILRAKLGATLIGMLVFSLPFWPLLLPCVRLDVAFKNTQNGVNVLQAVLCAGVIAATAVCYTLWGMVWSCRCRKTAAAVGWSLGTLFLALVFIPIFIAVELIENNGRGLDDPIWMFHPFVALAFIAEERKMGLTVGAIIFLLMAAGVLWLWLRRELEREW